MDEELNGIWAKFGNTGSNYKVMEYGKGIFQIQHHLTPGPVIGGVVVYEAEQSIVGVIQDIVCWDPLEIEIYSEFEGRKFTHEIGEHPSGIEPQSILWYKGSMNAP